MKNEQTLQATVWNQRMWKQRMDRQGEKRCGENAVQHRGTEQLCAVILHGLDSLR